MDSKSIERLEERLRVAMLESDVAELGVLLSEQLIFTTFLGELISKQQDLEAHKSGHVLLHSIEISQVLTKMFGEAALVNCLAEIDATFDGDRTKKQFRFTRLWATAESGTIQVMAGQATLVYDSLIADLGD